jgi:hypothetical protein
MKYFSTDYVVGADLESADVRSGFNKPRGAFGLRRLQRRFHAGGVFSNIRSVSVRATAALKPPHSRRFTLAVRLRQKLSCRCSATFAGVVSALCADSFEPQARRYSKRTHYPYLAILDLAVAR